MNKIENSDQRVVHQQTLLLYRSLNTALLATVINSLLLIAVLWPTLDLVTTGIWLAGIVVISTVRCALGLQFGKSDITVDNFRPWFDRFLWGTIAAAVIWGAAPLLLFPAGDMARQVFLIFVVGGMAAGSLTSLSYAPAPIYAFLTISMIPLIYKVSTSQIALGLIMALMLAFYLVMFLVAARRMCNDTAKDICNTFEAAAREAALRQSEQRLQTLLNTASDAFFLHDLQGNMVDCNDQACISLGYTREELLSLKVSDVEKGADPALLLDLWPKLKSMAKLEVECVHQRKDGTSFPVEVHLGPVEVDNEPYISASIRDITVRKQAERMIAQSRQRMALHMQNTPLGVVECDSDFRVTEWNAAAERIFGYTRAEALGQKVAPLIIPNSQVIDVKQVWQQVIVQQASKHSSNDNITKSGRLITCEWYNTPLIDEDGVIFGMSSLVQDITEHRMAEQALIEAKLEAEHSNQIKTQFLSRMSHELRTPLNAILGFGQLLQFNAAKHDEVHRANVEEILKAGEYLLDLINELLDMAKIESGTLDLRIEEVAIDTILTQCLKLIERQAEASGLTLENDLPANPPLIKVDATRCKQILLNLLTNAVKYNRDGGSISIHSEMTDNQCLRISVVDTGCGINESRLGDLFVPFIRIDTSHSIEGTGIGLSISKHMAEAMKGAIGAESVEGEGSTFWVEFPLADSG